MLVGTDHVGVRVADMERSIAFYTNVLGLRVTKRVNVRALELAFLEIPGTASATQVELVAGATDHSPSDGLVNHVAFAVTDIDAGIKRLRAHGVALLSEGPITLWEGKRIVFFRGPDGERLELVEDTQKPR